MKKWKCTVCGYIHEGDEPPEKCPVCGADRSKFTLVEPEGPAEKKAAEPAAAPPRAGAGVKKWKCSVCGYIHEGTEPPEKCPVCGADRSKFVVVEDNHRDSADAETPASSETAGPSSPAPQRGPDWMTRYDKIFEMSVRHHAHPISVHIPNGVLPISVAFVFLATLFEWTALGQAAFFNMVCVVLAMPVVLFSGYIVWQRKFMGAMTRIFKIKIALAGTVTTCALVLAIWMAIDPGVTASPSTGRTIFLLINLAMFAAAAGAGFIGGKLVFKD